MKPNLSYALLSLAATVLCLSSARAVTTINWGSPVDSVLKDSYGNTLGAGYSFELGAFANGFTPTASNYADWALNWRVFDKAAYNVTDGYFTGTAEIDADGFSNSPDALAAGSNTFEFSELDAYLWVYNQQSAEFWVSQWLLVRDDTWTFPVKSADCCPTSLPLEWSISDLSNTDTPVYGEQGGTSGGGTTFNDTASTLETYSLVPEVGSLPVVIGVVLMSGFHRRRGKR